MKSIQDTVAAHRRSLSTGSPEAAVAVLTDDELRDTGRVRRMTRGLHWGEEPDAFEAAARRELEWRAENGLEFGWRRR